MQQPVMFLCGTLFVIVDMKVCPPAIYSLHAGYCMVDMPADFNRIGWAFHRGHVIPDGILFHFCAERELLWRI